MVQVHFQAKVINTCGDLLRSVLFSEKNLIDQLMEKVNGILISIENNY